MSALVETRGADRRRLESPDRPADTQPALWPLGPPDRPRPPWRWWHAVLGFVASQAAAVATVLLVFRVAGLPYGEPYAEILFAGPLVAVVLLVAWRAGGARTRLLGFQRTPARAAVGWVLLAWVMQVFGAIIWRMASHSTAVNAPPIHVIGGAVGAAIAVALIAPVAEEIVFRGFLYGALRNRLGTGLASTVGGVAFGVAHAFPGGAHWSVVPPLVFFGIVLCLLYERTGSLLPCIAAHMLQNSIVTGFVTGSAGPVVLAWLAAAALFLVAPWRFARLPRDARTVGVRPPVRVQSRRGAIG